MNDYNYYPAPQPRREIVYVPQMGNTRINRSVSVIGIILIIALLFVGMKFISDDGFYAKTKVTWNRGYIDENGEGVQESGALISWNSSKNTHNVGMYTVDPIPIKYGVRIERDFDSKLQYKILCYNDSDSFIGTYGTPYGSNVTLTLDMLSGESANGQNYKDTKYIRIFAYPKSASDLETYLTLKNGGLTFYQWLVGRKDFTIYVNQSDVKDKFEEWFG